jgi:hypothetical protein
MKSLLFFGFPKIKRNELTNQLTKSLEQSPAWEASQEISCILCNPEVHDRVHNSLHLSLFWARSIQSTPLFTIIFAKNSFLYYPSIYALVFQVVSFPHVYPPQPCVHLSSLLYVPRALPHSFFLIWLPEHLARITDNGAPHYGISARLLLRLPSQAEVFFVVPYSRAPSVYLVK